MATQTVYRDSKTGKFISGKTAKRRPSTTEKQQVRRKPKKEKL